MRILLALLALPFLVFELPLLSTLLSHTYATGFDRDGRWSESMGEFRELLSPPSSASVSLSPPPEPGEPERPMIFAIGKTGSGIGLQHGVQTGAALR